MPWQSAGDAELADGAYLRIDVTDTGCGMDAETAARALEPFFTTKPVGKGTGLGLSMVYGFARQSGGTVLIDSTPGQGTVVSLFLRQVDGAGEDEAEAEKGSRTAPLGNATVLLVDDDADVRSSTANTLDALGYTVIEADNGASALKLLATTSPDLALLDYAMPEMNGAELARAIRERNPRLPIIFASGFADTEALREAVGPDAAVLRKPFGADDLGAVVAAVLREGAPGVPG
jgi:CheY-like chemotaxis protein